MRANSTGLRQTIDVAGRTLGADTPCLIIAEVGINHNGDLDIAHRAVDAAADSGADAVKFQNYRTEDFIVDRSLTYDYVSRGAQVSETQYEMFKRCELAREDLGELKRHCDQRRVVFLSTPTHPDGVRDLLAVGAAMIKNGSDELSNPELIEAMARSGLPTAISTGMATVADIALAVDAFRVAGGTDLALLHCTSVYPTDPADVHLAKIPSLAAAFDCPIGLSDHTEGITAAIGAVAFGACLIEKHFTLDRDLAGPDHRFSSDPGELEALVGAVRTMEQMIGSSRLELTEAERASRSDYRVSCVVRHDLAAGHTLRRQDLAFARPGTGIAPGSVDFIVGRRLVAALSAGEAVMLRHLE